MKHLKLAAILLFIALIFLPLIHSGEIEARDDLASHVEIHATGDAPAGFDERTNGFVSQAVYDADRVRFEQRETRPSGLGPVYNAQSCAECHQNPHTGGASQITVVRAGRLDSSGNFIAPPGGTLIQDRAIHPAIQERLTADYNVRSLRVSVSLLGSGFVEAIDDATLIAIANGQPAGMRGEVVLVPVLESPGATRVGRFGWKAQHGSLLSFAADSYLNEMGITNRLFPTENTSLGQSVAIYDAVADPEDNANDIDAFARFMRALKAPPRDDAAAATDEVMKGSQLFDKAGCAVCHVRTITTAPAGTMINGGAFAVPEALGGKTIHPFSDFLLHDVGTGDGIIQNGPASTRNKIRTPALWGLRARNRYMHDGASLTLEDAILRHGGEAAASAERFRAMRRKKRASMIAFLNSL